MRIVYEESFKNSLKEILQFIAEDKQFAAKKFNDNLLTSLGDLQYNPKMYRKSFYSDDDDYRDMIFKGYTITYKVEYDQIKVLDIFKWKNR